ncbi:PTS sugar transporter subunit IIB [Carnobacteriaceae bacterium 52-44]
MDKKALVACRTGMGSSMMLKIKVQQVVRENNLPIKVYHDNIDAISQFNGDLLITLDDLKDDVKERVNKEYVIGIKSLTDKQEIEDKLLEYMKNVE